MNFNIHPFLTLKTWGPGSLGLKLSSFFKRKITFDIPEKFKGYKNSKTNQKILRPKCVKYGRKFFQQNCQVT